MARKKNWLKPLPDGWKNHHPDNKHQGHKVKTECSSAESI
jgi:hypothetical protein